jgi:putative redox protein
MSYNTGMLRQLLVPFNDKAQAADGCKHTLTIDVPADMGRTDRGPQPPQLFITSLGSCIGAFVAQYGERTSMNTSGMTVDRLSFEKATDPTRLINLGCRQTVKCRMRQRVSAIHKIAEQPRT